MTDLSHTFKKAQLEFNNGVRKTLLLTEQRNTADKKKLAQKNKEVSKLSNSAMLYAEIHLH